MILSEPITSALVNKTVIVTVLRKDNAHNSKVLSEAGPKPLFGTQ